FSSSFLLESSVPHRYLHSFPTRRSSDLDLFVHQTVASLTANLGDQAPEVAEQGPVVGAVPLTPIQHWFFDTQADALNHLTFSMRSEEHTSELQSRSDLVCRLLLEKKKTI